jgi:hypothetical protein
MEIDAAFKIDKIGNQRFTAPNRAIGSIASAISCDPDNWLCQPVLGKDAGDVRVMMLDADFLRNI